MPNSLITLIGGSGFLGRHIVRELAQAGYRVRVAVRSPNRAYFLKPMGRVGQIQIVYCDVTDETSLARAIAGAEAVVNLVGILAPFGRQTFEAVHAEAPGLIGKLAAAQGVKRVVHLSAIGASGDAPSRYARSKAAGEAALTAQFPNATVLRPSIVFGPEDHFFNRFANWARYLPALPLIGGGKTRFQPVFVGDVARAVRIALDNPKTQGRVYELGGPQIYTFRELMERILAETGRKRLLIPVPFPLAILKAVFLGLWPWPILTVDQVRSLKMDTVVGPSPGTGTLADLGIEPVAVDAVIPSYLWRFRKMGQFEAPAF